MAVLSGGKGWRLREHRAHCFDRVWSFCHTLRDDGVGYGDYFGVSSPT